MNTDDWSTEQQHRANLDTFRHQQPDPERRGPRPVFTLNQLAIADLVFNRTEGTK